MDLFLHPMHRTPTPVGGEAGIQMDAPADCRGRSGRYYTCERHACQQQGRILL